MIKFIQKIKDIFSFGDLFEDVRDSDLLPDDYKNAPHFFSENKQEK